MTVDEIIKQVRWCIDEESCNSSNLADVIDEKDDSYMDNIIRAKIPDALDWVSINAPSSFFSVGSSATTDMIKEYGTSSTDENKKVGYVKNWNSNENIGCISFPADSDGILRLVRLRGSDWHKAILKPFEEDSEEALMMFDDTACGTKDRPMAVIVRSNPTSILVQPPSSSFSVTFVKSVSETKGADGSVSYDIPKSFRSPLVYYLAFLLLSAYDDSKATIMYNIALQMLGATQGQNK